METSRTTVILRKHEATIVARAAAAVGESKSAFLRAAGLERADRIAARAQFTDTLADVRRSLEPTHAK